MTSSRRPRAERSTGSSGSIEGGGGGGLLLMGQPAPATTGTSTGYPRIWAPPATSRRWSSATSTTSGTGAASPRPVQRRGDSLRRLPTRRPRRGRRGWDPQHPVPGPARTAPPRHPRRVAGRDETARVRLPGHVRHRVHRGEGHALDPPNAGRQTHRTGRGALRGGHGRRGSHRPAPGGSPCRPCGPGAVATATIDERAKIEPLATGLPLHPVLRSVAASSTPTAPWNWPNRGAG